MQFRFDTQYVGNTKAILLTPKYPKSLSSSDIKSHPLKHSTFLWLLKLADKIILHIIRHKFPRDTLEKSRFFNIYQFLKLQDYDSVEEIRNCIELNEARISRLRIRSHVWKHLKEVFIPLRSVYNQVLQQIYRIFGKTR